MLIITVFLFLLSVFSLLMTDFALGPVQEGLCPGVLYEIYCSTLALASTISRNELLSQCVISFSNFVKST